MTDADLTNSLSDQISHGVVSFDHTGDAQSPRVVRGWPGKVEQFAGLVRGGPASGGADYSDARYFVDRAAAQAPGNYPLSARIDMLPGLRQMVTATNLAELPGGTHLLAAGTLVQVFVLYARESPGAKVYVFNQPPAQTVVVQISAAAAGAGEYSGKVIGGAAMASGATDLSMPAGMVIPASDNALILNVEEDGEPGHRLKNGSYALGVVRGMTADSPPRAIVVVSGGIGRTDSPTTLGRTSDASESAESTTWAKATDGSPVNLYVVSRVVYNPAGDQALYSFLRMMSFDARGVLVSVGAETRVTVDATEACP
jgi:hypothetical protein